jgi:hypothetical protein
MRNRRKIVAPWLFTKHNRNARLCNRLSANQPGFAGAGDFMSKEYPAVAEDNAFLSVAGNIFLGAAIER